MKPIKFEEQNTNYIAEGCRDLPAYKAEDQIISCWELTDKEKEEVQKTGVVWLSVLGQQQPPVWLGVETPFIKLGGAGD